MTDEQRPEAEATLANCLHCGVPIEPAKRGGTKLFCCDRHRVAYRDAQIQVALGHVMKTLQALNESMGEFVAALEANVAAATGAMQALEKGLKHPRKKKMTNDQKRLDTVKPQE